MQKQRKDLGTTDSNTTAMNSYNNQSPLEQDEWDLQLKNRKTGKQNDRTRTPPVGSARPQLPQTASPAPPTPTGLPMSIGQPQQFNDNSATPELRHLECVRNVVTNGNKLSTLKRGIAQLVLDLNNENASGGAQPPSAEGALESDDDAERIVDFLQAYLSFNQEKTQPASHSHQQQYRRGTPRGSNAHALAAAAAAAGSGAYHFPSGRVDGGTIDHEIARSLASGLQVDPQRVATLSRPQAPVEDAYYNGSPRPYNMQPVQPQQQGYSGSPITPAAIKAHQSGSGDEKRRWHTGPVHISSSKSDGGRSGVKPCPKRGSLNIPRELLKSHSIRRTTSLVPSSASSWTCHDSSSGHEYASVGHSSSHKTTSSQHSHQLPNDVNLSSANGRR